MKTKALWLCVTVLALVTVASAQTKISGTAQCGKPEPTYAIQVGDRPDHSFALSQVKCEYTKPIEMAGIQAKEFLSTYFSEISGARATLRASVDATMANGDKYRARAQGSAILKEGVLESAEGTWSFGGGTGKLKGIKGKGTFKGKGGPEGITYEIEGEYELPK